MSTIKRTFSFLFIALFWSRLTAVPVLSAESIENIEFSTTYQQKGLNLERSGVGVFKYLGLFRIYEGALYLPPGIDKERVLSNIPKRLEVKYLRSFNARDFGPATYAGMKKNVDPITLKRLESKIELHNSLYDADINIGDRVSLTYIPSSGTILEINGKTKGVIAGVEFAEALFSMWLGNKPFDSNFKRALLGEEG